MKWQEIPTPCYVVDEKKLKQNLKILQNLEQETGCHVLLAQKAFSMFSKARLKDSARRRSADILPDQRIQ